MSNNSRKKVKEVKTTIGWGSTEKFDSVVTTMILPDISKAYGELACVKAPVHIKNALLTTATEHLCDILCRYCKQHCDMYLFNPEDTEQGKDL